MGVAVTGAACLKQVLGQCAVPVHKLGGGGGGGGGICIFTTKCVLAEVQSQSIQL